MGSPRLYDLGISPKFRSKELCRTFNHFSMPVQQAFFHCLDPYETSLTRDREPIRKVIWRLVEEVENPDVQVLIDVLAVETDTLDIDRYLTLNSFEQDELIVDFLQEGMHGYASIYGWSHDRIDEATHSVRACGYRDEGKVSHPKASPSRKLRAYLWQSCSRAGNFLYLIVEDREGVIVERFMIAFHTVNVDSLLHEYIGSIQWRGNRTVQVQSRSGRIVDCSLDEPWKHRPRDASPHEPPSSFGLERPKELDPSE